MNRKKIGIITVHRNVNYGANLQAFASCKYLNNSGFDAEIIDYYPKEIDKGNYLFSWLKLSYDRGKTKSLVHNSKLIAALALTASDKNKRLKSFYDFRKKNCKLSRRYESVNEIANGGYTDVVCGSDQIWNPDITNGINPYYFGDINGVFNKVSYAASLGKAEYKEEDEKKASELIKDIDYVSVREEKSVEYVKAISGKKVVAVCDPVFLLPKEEYEKIKEIEQVLDECKYFQMSPLISMIRCNHCMVDNGKAITVSPEGNFGLCEHWVETDFWGHVDTPDEKDMDMIKSYRHYMPDLDICEDCPIYPRCVRNTKCEEQSKCYPEYKEWLIRKVKKSVLDTFYKTMDRINNMNHERNTAS